MTNLAVGQAKARPIPRFSQLMPAHAPAQGLGRAPVFPSVSCLPGVSRPNTAAACVWCRFFDTPLGPFLPRPLRSALRFRRAVLFRVLPAVVAEPVFPVIVIETFVWCIMSSAYARSGVLVHWDRDSAPRCPMLCCAALLILVCSFAPLRPHPCPSHFAAAAVPLSACWPRFRASASHR